jgi:hypothetical protein
MHTMGGRGATLTRARREQMRSRRAGRGQLGGELSMCKRDLLATTKASATHDMHAHKHSCGSVLQDQRMADAGLTRERSAAHLRARRFAGGPLLVKL